MERAFIDHLVRLTSDGQAAKQPARLEALPAASRQLVELFVKARLLVSGKGSDGAAVEIAHEALLRTWPTLVTWIERGREALLQRLRVRRLGEDLSANEPARERRQALEQLAALAASGGAEARAVEQEGAQPLAALLSDAAVPEADRQDAALVLALIGDEQPLRDCLGDMDTSVALRRRAVECLGLLAKRSGDATQRNRIVEELEGWLRRDALDVVIEPVSDPILLASAKEAAQRQMADQLNLHRAHGGLGNITETQLLEVIRQTEELLVQQELWAMGVSPGWAQHDARLPLLQGASRALQLAASVDLPLLGTGPGRGVPMLTLLATEEAGCLRIRTKVIEVAVWMLPLPGDERLELVVVKEDDYIVGSSGNEAGREVYQESRIRQKYARGDVEEQRKVHLTEYAIARYPLSQAQWHSVVEASAQENHLVAPASPETFRPENFWERYGEPGALPVDYVSWVDCQQWIKVLNHWLALQWPLWRVNHPRLSEEAVQLVLPSESGWEAACRASSAGPFHFGVTLDPAWARYNSQFTYGKGRRGKSEKRPATTGSSGLTNMWGIAEMHGQVEEWCADYWHPRPTSKRQDSRGKGFGGGTGSRHHEEADCDTLDTPDPSLAKTPLEQQLRISRGGSWVSDPHNARSSFRGSSPPGTRLSTGGFRPCCLLQVSLNSV